MSDNQREAGTIILDPTHASFAPEETVHDLGATHFIGIGGAGMSVLAEMLHEQGVKWTVQIVNPAPKPIVCRESALQSNSGSAQKTSKANIPSYSPAPSIRQSGNRRSIRSRRTHRAPQRHSRIADERKNVR